MLLCVRVFRLVRSSLYPSVRGLFPFRPGSACVFALLERGFRDELAVFVVDSDLNLVEVFHSLLTASIGVRSDLFRDGCLVACHFLRRAIEAVFYRIARIFELFDGRLILLVEADCYLDVLLRGLRGTSNRRQLCGQRLGVNLRFFNFQSQFVRVNERES